MSPRPKAIKKHRQTKNQRAAFEQWQRREARNKRRIPYKLELPNEFKTKIKTTNTKNIKVGKIPKSALIQPRKNNTMFTKKNNKEVPQC